MSLGYMPLELEKGTLSRHGKFAGNNNKSLKHTTRGFFIQFILSVHTGLVYISGIYLFHRHRIFSVQPTDRPTTRPIPLSLLPSPRSNSVEIHIRIVNQLFRPRVSPRARRRIPSRFCEPMPVGKTTASTQKQAQVRRSRNNPQRCMELLYLPHPSGPLPNPPPSTSPT
jgi:hypothetical protein